MADTLQDKKDLQRGSATKPTVASKGSAQTCTVVDVHPNTYTCDVKAADGRYVMGLAWPGTNDPSGLSGEVSVPKRGQQFVLMLARNEFQLGHSIPGTTLSGPPEAEHRVFHSGPAVGGKDPAYSDGSPRNYRGSKPADVLPGDWLRVASSGNLVGVLEGGISLLKATEHAKVVANRVGDTVQVVGRNLEIDSDFGPIRSTNVDGKVSFTLKGGSQQLTESSAHEENFTVRAEVGNAGGLVRLRITDAQGRDLATSHYSPEGAVTQTGISLSASYQNSITYDTFGAETHMVGGNVAYTVGGGIEYIAGGGFGAMSAGPIGLKTAASASVSAARDVSLTAGGMLRTTAMGGLLAVPGNVAYKTVVANGSWVVDIGNPAAGDLGSAMSGYQLKTQVGDITMQTMLGKIAFKTTPPNTVHLGGLAPVFSGVLFEMLKTWFEAFGQILDMHVHVHPVFGPVLPTATPPWKMTSAAFDTVKSRLVKFGG